MGSLSLELLLECLGAKPQECFIVATEIGVNNNEASLNHPGRGRNVPDISCQATGVDTMPKGGNLAGILDCCRWVGTHSTADYKFSTHSGADSTWAGDDRYRSNPSGTFRGTKRGVSLSP